MEQGVVARPAFVPGDLIFSLNTGSKLFLVISSVVSNPSSIYDEVATFSDGKVTHRFISSTHTSFRKVCSS